MPEHDSGSGYDPRAIQARVVRVLHWADAVQDAQSVRRLMAHLQQHNADLELAAFRQSRIDCQVCFDNKLACALRCWRR